MADTTVVFPKDIDGALTDRAATWVAFDQAIANFNEVKDLGKAVGSGGDGTPPAERLTNEKSPPSEVAAVVVALKAEIANIKKAQDEIEMHQAEISRLETQRVVMIAVGIVAIIVIAIFFLAQLGVF